ncbi:hypothetical protein [Stackebrandtia soli]|uniref:hypothetical protein n=1 Tax=Stackebrandtia soli TaxID=1892856 RepID=UPI0039EC682D
METIDADRTRLVGTTDEPHWYIEQLAGIRAYFRIIAPRELRDAARFLGSRLLRAAGREDAS